MVPVWYLASMLAPILFLMIQAAHIGQDDQRASHLYAQCQATVRIMECIRYVEEFLDGLDLGGNKKICVGGASFGTVARVYVKYMQANPKMMDLHESIALALALAESYPCPTPAEK
jgi:hypothetical protein